MNTLIFRTMAPLLVALMLMFSVVVLLRGHNAPGGGFIGGLIAAAAFALLGMSHGVGTVHRVLRFNPAAYAGLGVLIAIACGMVSLLASDPFLTGLWLPGYLFGTPALFDIGVYFVVAGTVTAVALALEDGGAG